MIQQLDDPYLPAAIARNAQLAQTMRTKWEIEAAAQRQRQQMQAASIQKMADAFNKTLAQKRAMVAAQQRQQQSEDAAEARQRAASGAAAARQKADQEFRAAQQSANNQAALDRQYTAKYGSDLASLEDDAKVLNMELPEFLNALEEDDARSRAELDSELKMQAASDKQRKQLEDIDDTEAMLADPKNGFSEEDRRINGPVLQQHRLAILAGIDTGEYSRSVRNQQNQEKMYGEKETWEDGTTAQKNTRTGQYEILSKPSRDGKPVEKPRSQMSRSEIVLSYADEAKENGDFEKDMAAADDHFRRMDMAAGVPYTQRSDREMKSWVYDQYGIRADDDIYLREKLAAEEQQRAEQAKKAELSKKRIATAQKLKDQKTLQTMPPEQKAAIIGSFSQPAPATQPAMGQPMPTSQPAARQEQSPSLRPIVNDALVPGAGAANAATIERIRNIAQDDKTDRGQMARKWLEERGLLSPVGY